MRVIPWIAVAAFGCSSGPKGEPVLELTLFPKLVSGATPVQVKVVATRADGKVGTGEVRIESDLGSLSVPVDMALDGFGTARAELICDPAQESGCAEGALVRAVWTSIGLKATAEARLAPGSSAGTGGGTATGGGAGTGGGAALATDEMLLFGSTEADRWADTNLPTLNSIAAVSSPYDVHVGFPPNAKPLLMDGNGDLVYFTEAAPIRAFRWSEDQGLRDTAQGWVYPFPLSNADEEVFSTCYTGSVFARPDSSALVWYCNYKTLENGTEVDLGGRTLLMAGPGDTFLTNGVGNYYIRTRAGTEQLVTPTPPSTSIPVRAVLDGFLLIQTPQCNLFHISLDGTLTLRGTYSTIPPSGSSFYNTDGCLPGFLTSRSPPISLAEMANIMAVDGAGDMYNFASQMSTLDMLIVRRAIGAPATVVYDPQLLRGPRAFTKSGGWLLSR